MALAIVAAATVACGLVPTATPPAATGTLTPPLAGSCGDSLCGEAESAANCPGGCQLPDIALPGDVPPLNFFYAIHTHASGDYLPYTDDSMSSLDAQTRANMVAAIDSIAQVLDRYGVKGTWEVVHGTATGLCTYGGDGNVFRMLQDRGHEIGAHAHRIDQIDDAYHAVRDDCGIAPETNSGFITLISGAASDGAQGAMSLVLKKSVDLGMAVGTWNLSPGGGRNPFTSECNAQIGVGNDMWPDTGNLMFPWRPDYLNGDVCADSPQGQMVLLDHVSIEWLILPGESGPPDVVGMEHFEQLRGWFDGALAFMDQERPERTAVWGFVTHITEYAIGSRAENPPHPQALAALDAFLAYVDAKRAEGRVVYATASEIAALASASP